jgi:hypothetical protein
MLLDIMASYLLLDGMHSLGIVENLFAPILSKLSIVLQCESKTAMGMRTSTIASGIDINVRKLPTVFRWSGAGTNVFVSGSFDGWKTKIPLVRRFVMIVLIHGN